MTDVTGRSGGSATQLPKLSAIGPSGNAAAGPQAAVAAVVTATGVQKDYDPTPDQEKARANIAYILLWTLVGIVGVLLIVGGVLVQDCFSSTDCARAKETMPLVLQLVSIVFTPIVGLVGSVIGFYFGFKAGSGK